LKITYFVHGTTTDNEKGLATGWAPEKEFKESMTAYIDTPYPNGESYKDVEKRMSHFLKEISHTYNGKHIVIVAHQAPQLALDVLLKGKTWNQAIAEDWRNTKAWQPGWEYLVEAVV
jgi:hypothetical protein